MKVAILNYWYEIGGTENAMIGMVKELVKRNHDVTIFSYYNEGELLDRLPKEVKVKKIELPFLVKSLIKHYDSKGLVRFIQKSIHKTSTLFIPKKEKEKLYRYVLSKIKPIPGKYDLLLDFYGYGDLLTAIGARKITATKKATWLHDEKVFFVSWIRRYYKDYNRIFCVSESVRDNLLKEYPKLTKKTEVFYNFIDLDRIINKSKEQCGAYFKGDFKIVTVGRLTEQKGVDIAVETANKLNKQKVSVYWYVYGDGPEREKLQKKIDEYGLTDRFFLMGTVSNPFPYIKNCDLYAQPSRHEGYCTTLIEAKTLNKPIISSDIPSARVQIKDGVNGFLCDLNSDSLSEKIKELVQSPDKLNVIVENLANEEKYSSKDFEKIERMCGE
jgi:glycosyltransferase involved in cell wall biosynthesis